MISIYTWDQRRLLHDSSDPGHESSTWNPSSRYIFLNFVVTLKYHSSPCLSLSLFLLSPYFFLPQGNRILSAILTDEIRSYLSLPLSFSTSFYCSRRIAGAQSVEKASSDRESRPHFFVRVKKKRRNKKREKTFV